MNAKWGGGNQIGGNQIKKFGNNNVFFYKLKITEISQDKYYFDKEHRNALIIY